MTHIDLAEREAEKLMTGHLEDREIIGRESNYTITFILAALSGLFGYALTLFGEDPHQLLLPVSISTLYLLVLGILLVCLTMMAKPVYHLGNEPNHLLAPEVIAHDIEQVRKFECENLQFKIEENRRHNEDAASALNRIRIATLFTPVVFGLAWFLVGV